MTSQLVAPAGKNQEHSRDGKGKHPKSAKTLLADAVLETNYTECGKRATESVMGCDLAARTGGGRIYTTAVRRGADNENVERLHERPMMIGIKNGGLKCLRTKKGHMKGNNDNRDISGGQRKRMDR